MDGGRWDKKGAGWISTLRDASALESITNLSHVYPNPNPIPKIHLALGRDCSVCSAVKVGGGIMAEMVGALEWRLEWFGVWVGFVMGGLWVL